MSRKEPNKGRKFYRTPSLKANPRVIKASLRSSTCIRVIPKATSEINFDVDHIYYKAITDIYNQEISDIDNFVKFAEKITNEK
jgi:hypothetical protein